MDDFETAFFAELAEKAASLKPDVTAYGEVAAKEPIYTALRFTTAKQKIKGLKVSLIDDGYRISGSRGLLHQAFNLRKWILADNNVDLSFDEEMLAYAPEEDLIKKTKIPLWVLKGSPDGSVSIRRVWNQ